MVLSSGLEDMLRLFKLLLYGNCIFPFILTIFSTNSQADESKIPHYGDRRPTLASLPVRHNRQGPCPETGDRRSLLAPRPSVHHLRRGTVQQLPSHARHGLPEDSSSRRNTVVMPLMAFFSRQGRFKSNSFSFRSGSNLQPLKALLPLENTYRLEPTHKFPEAKAKALMAQALEARLVGKEYQPTSMAYESKILSDLVKERVKAVAPPRYKLVCWVSIGQKGQSDIRIASRGLWNEDCDTFCQEVYENASLYAVAVLYAVYQE